MHVIVSRIPLRRPLNPEEVARIARELPPMVAEAPGCHGFYWARSGEAEALTVSLWDSEAEADAAFARVGPWLGATLGAILAGPPERRAGEVLVAHQVGERR